MKTKGDYIIFSNKDNVTSDTTLAIKNGNIAAIYKQGGGETEIYLSGNRKLPFYVNNTVDEILSKIEDSTPYSSYEDKSAVVIDQLRKDRDALFSALTQIRDYGQEKIDQCRNFDTDSIVNLGDIMHMTSIANEMLDKDAGEDLDELIKGI